MQLFWGVKHDNSTIIIEGEEVVHLNKSNIYNKEK